MLFKRKEELLVTDNHELFRKVSCLLGEKKIVFETKIVNNSIVGSRKGTFYGEIPSRPGDQSIYYIYVDKKDLEEAEGIVYECKK